MSQLRKVISPLNPLKGTLQITHLQGFPLQGARGYNFLKSKSELFVLDLNALNYKNANLLSFFYAKQYIKYFVFLILAVLGYSCEYYLGLDQQPKFRNQNIEEGLNIFALLRPDSVEGYNRSSVYVHKVLPVMQTEGFNILQNTDIRIEKIINDEIVDAVSFPLVASNAVFTDISYRPVSYFAPKEGERYRIVCKHVDYPEATGETIIPSQPEIKQNSLKVSGRVVSFTLSPDSLIGMIDIYHVINNTHIPAARIIPTTNEETDVELNLPLNPSGTKLLLFAYDHNMAVYIGNSNISLNFNKFRTTISTLESGFGVFGSMNFREVDLE